jgi:hypothetical protein
MIGGNWRARHARCAHWGVNFQTPPAFGLFYSVCLFVHGLERKLMKNSVLCRTHAL